MTDQAPLIPAAESQGRVDARTRRGRIQMLLLLLVCASPVIASYITFYWIKPAGGQNNYGELVYPVQEAPQTFFPSVHGKWTLVLARPAANCEQDEQNCARLLYLMRQVRAALGKERTRVQIIWIMTDQGSPSERIQRAYDEEVAGVKFYAMPKDQQSKEELLRWLDQDHGGQKIQLLDPTGARMMRFPVDGQSPEFSKMKKDLEKLLKWNPTGKYGQ